MESRNGTPFSRYILRFVWLSSTSFRETLFLQVNRNMTVALLFTVLLNTVSSLTVLRRGTGGVAFYNNCNASIYSFTTLPAPAGVVHTSNGITPGSWYWEPYQYPDNGGVSIKLSRSNGTDGPITQLEYSFTGQTLWYDLSNVNCGPTSQTSNGDCPFLDGGMFLETDQEGCPTSTCMNQDLQCSQAYNLPDDNWAVRMCEYNNSNLVMFFCSSVALS